MTRAAHLLAVVTTALVAALAFGVLGGATPDTGATPPAAIGTSHICHNAPLQDTEHTPSLAPPARSVLENPAGLAAPVVPAGLRETSEAAASDTSPAPAGPLLPNRCGPPELQVFRI